MARAFCFDRYRWSLQLPGLVRTLGDHACSVTGQENWLVIRGMDDQGRPVEYEIYFRLRRRMPNVLRLVIESAYVRAPGRPAPGLPNSRKGRIRFQVMAAKVFRGNRYAIPATTVDRNRRLKR